MESEVIPMKIFGYQKDSEELMELEEISIQSDIAELDKIIEFLQYVKKQHRGIKEGEFCNSHFRDWDIEWKSGSPDIIVVTTGKQ